MPAEVRWAIATPLLLGLVGWLLGVAVPNWLGF